MRSLWAATATAGPAFPELTGELRTPGGGHRRRLHRAVGCAAPGGSRSRHRATRGAWMWANVPRASTAGRSSPASNPIRMNCWRSSDRDWARKVVETVGNGPDLVFDLIRKHRIDCDAVRAGWIQPASSERDLIPIRARVEQWQRRGADVESARSGTNRCADRLDVLLRWLDRSSRRHGAASLLRARTRACRRARAGVRICVRSPAIRLARQRPGLAHRQPARPPDRIDGHSGHRCLYRPSGRSTATKPGGGAFVPGRHRAPAWPLRHDILPQGQSASDTRRLLRYFRLDAGGRLLMGSRGSLRSDAHHRNRRGIFTTPCARSTHSSKTSVRIPLERPGGDHGRPAAPPACLGARAACGCRLQRPGHCHGDDDGAVAGKTGHRGHER